MRGLQTFFHGSDPNLAFFTQPTISWRYFPNLLRPLPHGVRRWIARSQIIA
jgi:hypothetical protein